MLFRYSHETELATRAFRPDLTELLVAWLDNLSPAVAHYLVAIRVGIKGQLWAQFLVPASNDVDAPLRMVTCVIDRDGSDTFSENTSVIFHDPYFALISLASLQRAASTI